MLSTHVNLSSGQAYICRPISLTYSFWAAQTYPFFCEWTKPNPCCTFSHLMPKSLILAHLKTSLAPPLSANGSSQDSFATC